MQPYGVVEQLKIHSHRKQTLASNTFMMPELQKTAPHKNRHFQTGNRLCLRHCYNSSPDFLSISLFHYHNKPRKHLFFTLLLKTRGENREAKRSCQPCPNPSCHVPHGSRGGQHWNPALTKATRGHWFSQPGLRTNCIPHTENTPKR